MSSLKIVVASGKGGTGKTTVAVNLSYYLAGVSTKKVSLFDCDVDGTNDNLFVKAKIDKSLNVLAKRPVWNEALCTYCGVCVTTCSYNAIAKVKNQILVFNELCHSCGACTYFCPSKALEAKEFSIGKIELSEANKPFYFAQGTLNVAQSLAPLVVRELKKYSNSDGINIYDASPGASCSVVATLNDVDFVILVTEATPFGLHDLNLAFKLVQKQNLACGIVINRSYGKDELIENFSKKTKVPILAKIAFERRYAEASSRGEVLVNKFLELKPIFSKIMNGVYNNKVIEYNSFNAVGLETVKVPESLNKTQLPSNNLFKEIVVISGKGGTGKTSVTAALAELMTNKVLSDCDVDAANLHLIIEAKNFEKSEFSGGKKFFILEKSCISCGKCKELCQFEAIKFINNKYFIDETICEGCGLCFKICPSNAINFQNAKTGVSYLSDSKFALFSHAELNAGEENSGKLVSQVRSNALFLTDKTNASFILSDGPPGTSCPAISSITGADYVLIVTEPTMSGVHDMIRALKLSAYFKIKTFIIINKVDLNLELKNEILSIASKYNSEVIGEIPYDKSVNDCLLEGKTIISHGKGIAYEAILKICEILKNILNGGFKNV